jgi:hypothetical protein
MSDFLSLIEILNSVIKNEGKRPLGRPRHRWEDNIKVDLKEVGVWTGLSWLRIGPGGRHV